MAGASVLIVEDDDILARVEDWRLKNLGYLISGRAATGAPAARASVTYCPSWRQEIRCWPRIAGSFAFRPARASLSVVRGMASTPSNRIESLTCA